jgi:hypothetical protein
MRRILLTVTITLATLAMSAAALAASTVTEIVPRRDRTPIEQACPFEVVASDRLEQIATSRYADDRDTLLARTIKGKQHTVFEQANGSTIEIETLGSTSITRNADGTYALVQRGSGFWFDDGSLSGTAELLRFTGTVRAVGAYDATTFSFQPIAREIDGVTSSICDMLVTGLKTRH